MTGTVFTKFFWSDWSDDEKLKLCTWASQGFWMRLLCLAAKYDPIGYVTVTGDPLSVTDLAKLTGASETEVENFLGDLERNGVFSRDRLGRIYSRRMVKDAKQSAINKKNGSLGGSPNLWEISGKSRPFKGADKAKDKPHKPSATSIPVSNETGNGLAKNFFNLKIRDAFSETLGEEWTVSWIDPCLWRDMPQACVVARTEFAAKRIRDGMRRLPADLRCPVIVEMAA